MYERITQCCSENSKGMSAKFSDYQFYVNSILTLEWCVENRVYTRVPMLGLPIGAVSIERPPISKELEGPVPSIQAETQ